MNEKISVIIPIYKVEQYLNRCVESVVNQTYKNLEIILVDDGSPDNCPKMCDDWAKKDGRIKVIHKENGGLSSARNAGLDVATGDYISFLDSDDYFLPSFSNVCENVARMNNIDIFVSPFEGCEIKYLYEYKVNGSKQKVNYPVSACGKIYSSKFINDNNFRFRVGVYHEDVDFTLKVLLLSPLIKNDNNRYYIYSTDNGDSITREINDKKFVKRVIDTIDIIDDINTKRASLINNNKNNYLKYASRFIFNTLVLVPRIKDAMLYKETIQYIDKHKYLYKKPQTFKNKILKLSWCVLGLKNTMQIVKRVKKF